MSLSRRNIFAFALIYCVLSFNVCVLTSNADDRDTALEILDNWTSIRWGVDNLAWIVYYPEELVDPWVNSEAEKQRLRPEQIEAYRKSFTDELKIGSATTVMLSVQAMGPTPLNIAPLSKNIVLIDSSGNRAAPIAFEKRLDGPMSGLVQGFIFFPLQTDKNFKIALSGLIPGRETMFTFQGSEAKGAITTTTAREDKVSAPQKPPQREVVVKIPNAKPTPPKAPEPPQNAEPDFSTEGEVFQPTMPPAAAQPEPYIDDSFPLDIPLPDEEVPAAAPPMLDERQVLPIYLKAWIDGDTDKMYSILSTESQLKISKELFDKEVMSGSFRNSLRSGYKVSWVDGSARVTVAKKVLFIRTLETKEINFVQEDGSARVSW
ncbi:MAG: hypothetical protein LBQ58_08425 [Synergistaceae bacterium]|jgi:hypothetical protein|nr:hypothetical protein [Synergistaceae bacterium]